MHELYIADARTQMHSVENFLYLRSVLSLASLGVACLLVGCAASHKHAVVPYVDPGRTQFESYCAACHVSNGAGMAAEAPPLDGSPWVTGPEDRLIKIVLHGLRGAIEVSGKTYNQEMPAVGQVLTDTQIASLLSFVRQRFGAASTPILPATVREVRGATLNRSGYWTVDELMKEP
jgi:mono/diheme cytochrome c family protein